MKIIKYNIERKVIIIKCPFCNYTMIWLNDIDLEDVSIDEEKGLIKIYLCSNDKCKSEAEFIFKEGEK